LGKKIPKSDERGGRELTINIIGKKKVKQSKRLGHSPKGGKEGSHRAHWGL